MHLHGFYFRIDAKGDGVRDTLLAPAMRRMAVTEIVIPGPDDGAGLVADRAGNWIFHCHFAGSSLASRRDGHGEGRRWTRDSDAHHMADAPHQMYGLVMGITRCTAAAPSAAAPTNARPIRLIVREKPNVYGEQPGYVVRTRRHGAERDRGLRSPVPGPTLVLERGKPVAVTIVNQSADRAAVHWHGIELESYPDGVPGWSGIGKESCRRSRQAIRSSCASRRRAPARSCITRTSTRFQQITSGLYGPLIVLEPGQKFDPRRRPCVHGERRRSDNERHRGTVSGDDAERTGASRAAAVRGRQALSPADHRHHG